MANEGTELARADEAKAVQPEVIKTLKGFDELREAVSGYFVQLSETYKAALHHGVEIGRLIVEYSRTAQIKKLVDAKNAEKKASGGAPIKYHCYVANLLAQSGVARKDWLEKCARGYERAKQLNFTVKNVNKLANTGKISGQDDPEFPVPVNKILPSPERAFPPEKKDKPERTQEEIDAETVAKIGTLLEKYFSAEDKPRIRNKEDMRKLNTILCRYLEPAGFTIMANARPAMAQRKGTANA